MPVRKFLLPVFSGLILLTLAFFPTALSAQQSTDPRLVESEAKQIASSYSNIQTIVSRHSVLERHVNWDDSRRVWEVFWINPANYRKVVSVDVDDATAKVISADIRPEAYGDILPMLSEDEAIEIAGNREKVKAELDGRPDIDPEANLGDDHIWTVSFYSGNDTVAEVHLDDDTGTVTEVMIGPQVAWQMARGYDGAFGRVINKPYIWLPLCLLFLAPFVDFRRPFRMLHLDLLVLLSFTVSHYYFNQGDIFKSVPLAYPPLVYLFVRLAYMAVRRHRKPDPGFAGAVSLESPLAITRPPAPRLHLNFSPKIIFIALLALLVFRVAINIADSNVVDVGYSGVIGAHDILEGKTPYGNMPSDDSNGDTYGPLNYLVYVPFERVMSWSGSWDDLPAAHATAIFFDLAAVAGMYFAGKRLASAAKTGPGEGRRLGLALAWGWAAYPYTTFVLSCNANDSIVAAMIIWGFVFLQSSPLAGVMLGFATQVKFFPALLGPLWASFPRTWRGWKKRLLFMLGFAVALAVVVPIIFLGDGAFTTFWERSLKWQLGRDSPFSIWGQHTDTLAGAQRVGQYILIALALASYFWPPKKSLIQVAAASGALLAGFEILQTHWFYLYIPWFFPLALIALLGWTIRKTERDEIVKIAPSSEETVPDANMA